jgi:hypothetical protein
VGHLKNVETRKETRTRESPVPIPTGTIARPEVEGEVKVQVFFIICVMVNLELFIGPPWLEREMRIHETPLVPRQEENKGLVVGPKGFCMTRRPHSSMLPEEAG